MHIQTAGKTILPSRMILRIQNFQQLPYLLSIVLCFSSSNAAVTTLSNQTVTVSKYFQVPKLQSNSEWNLFESVFRSICQISFIYNQRIRNIWSHFFKFTKITTPSSCYCHGNSQQSFMSTSCFSNAHGQVHLVAIAVSLKAMTIHVWSPLICSWFCHGRYARFEGVAVRVATVKCPVFALQFERSREHVVMRLCRMHCAGKIRPRIFMRNRFKPCEVWT